MLNPLPKVRLIALEAISHIFALDTKFKSGIQEREKNEDIFF